MGFGSSLKRVATGVATGGLSEVGNFLGGGGGGNAAIGFALGGASGAGLGALLSSQREAAGGAPLEREQITTANLFRNLSQQQQADLLVNNPNIETPQGMQLFDPLTNTIRLEESEFQKAQRGRQEGLAAGLSGQLGGQLPGTDPSSRFEEGRALLQPQFQEDRERLSQQLADQGLPIGSDAHTKELNRLEASHGQQLQSLAFNSVQTTEAQRSARFNEISSLLGQQQVGGVGFGQFQPQSSGLDLFGAEQAGLNRQFQAEQASKDRKAAQRAALIGAAGKLGGAGIGAAFSDRRLKENIKEVGTSDNGISIYEFDYIDKKHGYGRYRGVMAQEIKQDHPDAIITNKDGIMAVDYSLLDVDFTEV